MPYTLEQLLSEDIDKLVEQNPDIAAFFMSVMDHAIDHAAKRGTDIIEVDGVSVNREGFVKGHFVYGRRIH